MIQFVIRVEICARSSLGMQMYILNESFFRLSRVCFVESGRPLAAAVLATPIQNKWWH